MRGQENVRGKKVFVFSAVAKLVGAELTGGPEYVPNTDRRWEVFVNLLNDVRVLDDKFEGDNISSSMDAFVCTGATDEGGL